MRLTTLIILTIINTTLMAQNFHDLSINSIDGNEIKMSQYKGKNVLIVNVASFCGYTSQYTDLQALSEKFENLEVIGVPCNQFGFQEPLSTDSIKSFCSSKYAVTFPMTEKTKVKGKSQHPLFKWLTDKEQNKLDDYKVSWNFNKFLIDENGQLISHYGSSVSPLSEDITKHLK
ncbi:glutathione peroxidase [Flavobacteriales bacterium]|nr:glutathione peroxidase [Flavobacteriales bacterium]